MEFKRVTIRKNERGMLLRNGDFERILGPGTHVLASLVDKLTVEKFALEQPAFTHTIADYLLASEPAVVAEHFVRVELSETQAGLRCENGVLVEILPPATRRLYWRGVVDVRVDVVDIAGDPQLPDELAHRLTQTQLRQRAVTGLAGVLQVQVPDRGACLLYVDGKVTRLLEAGSYAFWKFGHNIAVELVDLRLQVVEVTGQEILTKDKVSLRLNLAATWRYTDVLKAHAQLAKPAEQMYRELQFGLRAAVGTRTLDELLENKTVIDEVVFKHVHAKLSAFGLELDGVGVKDIVLPGEMKTILAQVVEAGKAAEANVIRRREETAATRSLLNTAKVMEDNPVALRLKELETLERIAERIDKISVFGGLDQVLNGLVKLAPR
ncbi:slipin family protein [Caenimonas koreensis DSM 17982]|uniref:Slipin family protein n=1 Tax=Caenimonas koreensis DSM 17982 TaxID=1121255 RepID=A0A844B6X4_9BURK|nr:slipin family protein [Caenimonas koreensis]MRD48933.1 slipin family protein [Caenimonas koreensis DSM 17982]